MKDQEEAISPGLYIVGTPIGNLEDISFRAVRILKQVNWIAAEDTRQSKKLLNHFGIHTPLLSLHEHSSERKISMLIEKLRQGEIGAYISDAGTPGICDPGAELVEAAMKEKLQVIPIPGASAPITLLSTSGFLSKHFEFHGFFPRENKDRSELIYEVMKKGGIHIFFESPHRILSCFEFLAQTLPDTQVVIGRELTKHYETINRDSVINALSLLRKSDPKGEFVFALNVTPMEEKLNLERISKLLSELSASGVTQKNLVKIAMFYGLSKNDSYEIALKNKSSL